MRGLFERVMNALSHRPYWEGIKTGIELGAYLERDRIVEVLRDEFVGLPPAAYSVTNPQDLAEYLVSRVYESDRSGVKK